MGKESDLFEVKNKYDESPEDENVLEILCEIVKRKRTDQHLSQGELGKNAKVDQKTISRIERKENVSYEKVVRVLKELGVTLQDVANLFTLEYETKADEKDTSYDYSQHHTERLAQYFGMTYHCFYYKTKSVLTGKKEIDSCTITTMPTMNAEDGYLKADVEHHDCEYMCKIVSPTEFNYTYFYLASKNLLKERLILILPFTAKPGSKKVKKKINAAVGVMCHFPAAEDGEDVSKAEPCYQRVLLVSEEYLNEFNERKEELATEYLPIKIPVTMFEKNKGSYNQQGFFHATLVESSYEKLAKTSSRFFHTFKKQKNDTKDT